MLHNFSVGGLFGQQLSTSTLQDGLHGAETWANPWGEVEVFPLYEHLHYRETHRQNEREQRTSSQGKKKKNLSSHIFTTQTSGLQN